MRLRPNRYFANAFRGALSGASLGCILLASCRDATTKPIAPVLASERATIVDGAAPMAIVDSPIEDAAVPDVEPGPVTPKARPNEWCIEGLSALDDETCYLLPPNAVKTHKLLIYLHGILSPIPKNDPQRVVQTIVINAAKRSDYAVLIPRGQRGIGPGDSKDWWAWPTTASDYAKYAKRILARFADRRSDLEKLTGVPFARVYLAGSSNGAYFLTTVALHGAFPADGYGAMSGGSASGMQPSSLTGISPRPFYIGIPIFDSAKDGEHALARLLAAAKWPHHVEEHPFGHGAREAYLDEAFTYWDSQ